MSQAMFEPGERVIIRSGWGYAVEELATVDRVTKSGRVMIGKRVFLQDGWPYGGGSMNSSRLIKATPEAVERVAASTARSRATGIVRELAIRTDMSLSDAVRFLELAEEMKALVSPAMKDQTK